MPNPTEKKIQQEMEEALQGGELPHVGGYKRKPAPDKKAKQTGNHAARVLGGLL